MNVSEREQQFWNSSEKLQNKAKKEYPFHFSIRVGYVVGYLQAVKEIQEELNKLYHEWFDDCTGLEVSEEGAAIGALDMAYVAFQDIINKMK